MTDVDGYQWYRWAAAVRKREDLAPTTKLVAAALADHANNETGECWPSIGTLARACGLKLTTKSKKRRDGTVYLYEENRAVTVARQQLQAIGALGVEQPGWKRRRTNTYRLIAVEHWPEPRIGMRGTSRTDVRESTAPACGRVPHERAGEHRMSVRPELPLEGPRVNVDADVGSPESEHAAPAPLPSRTNNINGVVRSEERKPAAGAVDGGVGGGAEIVEAEIVEEPGRSLDEEQEQQQGFSEGGQVKLTGIWARKLREYASIEDAA